MGKELRLPADVHVSSKDPIQVLDLGPRLLNVLSEASIHTVGELVQRIEAGRLVYVRNIGPKSMARIKDSLARVRLVGAPESVDASDTPLSDDTPTQADASPTQTVYIPTIPIRVSSEDSIEVLGLSARSFNGLMRASIQTIGELLQAIESGILPWFVSGIGPKSIAEIEDSLSRVQLVDVSESIDKSDTPLHDATSVDESGALSTDGTFTVLDTSPLPVPAMLDQSSLPIDVLNLSTRIYNRLQHSGLHTVGQVAALSDEEILATRQVGPKALADIREALGAYLSEHPLPDEAEDSPPEPEPSTIELLPPQSPSPPLNLTSLDVLGLSIRPHNALRRRDITTVDQLARMSDEEIRGVPNIGPKSLAEIQEKLQAYLSANPIPDVTSTQAVAPTTQIVEVKVPVISEGVIRWQARLVKKQISAGLLHEQARIAGKSIAYWLSAVNKIVDHHNAYETMASILGASINICEELAFLFNHIQRQEHITLLLSVYGLTPKTLRGIGSEIGITGERVRQISNKQKRRIRTCVSSIVTATSVSDLVRNPGLLRMQSALLTAKDMGLDITYEEWERSIRSSGLVGTWASKDYMSVDPVEAMIAVCNLLADEDIPELYIPDNLKYAIELASRGKPGLPALVSPTFSERTPKLIKRHTRFSGGVNVRWLSQEIGENIATVASALQALGYTQASKDWFIRSVGSTKGKIWYYDSFHRALRKMSQYCGPLSIEDICSGIRYNASRTEFPIPPPNVMEQILQTHGYSSEDGLYYWDGQTNEELSGGESVIMNCLAQNGPVVHHAELAQAFIDSELSFPSLHATLQRSPLFERIGTGLYKLRGTSVTRQDIEQAEAAGERIPVNPEVEYDKRGNIIVSASLGVIAVGTGVIFSDQFPNLSGEWDCLVNGKRLGKLYATENEFRRLKKPFESLGCQAGDRLKFTFNTWDRTVTIERVGC
jgi:DNA-directed RNA polymerase alpha subunit